MINEIKSRDDVTIPSIFDFTEKKQRFAISNSGEFIDNVYIESDASSVIGKIVGRKKVSFQYDKRVFTAADVVLEGYLYKRGSWFRNWKKRYFILRKDIRALCYYESKENLKLLGYVKLGTNSSIEYSSGESVDGHKHVLAVQEDSRYDTTNTIYIRADNENTIRYWQHEIADEASNSNEIRPEVHNDWWSALIKNAVELLPERTPSKRLAISGSIVNSKRASSLEPSSDLVEVKQSNIKRGESVGEDFEQITLLAAESSDTAPNFNSHPDENTDDEEDDNDKNIGNQLNQETFTNKKSDNIDNNVPFKVENDYNQIESNNIDNPITIDNAIDSSIALADRQQHASVSTSNEDTTSRSLSLSSNTIPSPSSASPTSHHNTSPKPRPSSVILLNDVSKLLHRLSISTNDIIAKRKSFEDEFIAMKKFAFSSLQHTKSKLSNKTNKHDKTDKPYGPSPFQDQLVTKYELLEADALVGVQLSFNLKNVCNTNDRIFAVIYYMSNEENSRQWKQSSITEVKIITDRSTEDIKIHFNILQHIPKNNIKSILIRIFRLDDSTSTTTATITTKLADNKLRKDHSNPYILLGEVKISNSNWNLIPFFRIDMKILRDEIVDLSNVNEIFDKKIVLSVMKLSSKSLFYHRLTINQLFNHHFHYIQHDKIVCLLEDNSEDNNIHTKKLPSKSLGIIKPYAEAMYSLVTTTGQTLSLEQLYISTFSIDIAEAFIKFIQLERLPILLHIYQLILSYEKNINMDMSSNTGVRNSSNDRVDSKSESSISANQSAFILQETLKQCLNIIQDLILDIRNKFILTVETCLNARSNYISRETITNQSFDPTSLSMLRRSVWKKSPQWQFIATNLNVHLFTSRHFEFDEIINISENKTISNSNYRNNNFNLVSLDKRQYIQLNNKSNSLKDINKASDKQSNIKRDSFGIQSDDLSNMKHKSNNLHVIPTITLGCPAAHELKFIDGGLRRLFQTLSIEKRLIWLHILQSNISIDLLNSYITKYSKESSLFFNISYTIHESITESDTIQFIKNIFIYKRKYEISKRIDIVTSQILAYAATSCKTIVSLATQIGGVYNDILQRSLAIGFLLNMQSMLSTSGDELGMLEDCDIATNWLSLVSLRFVSYNELDTNITTSNNMNNTSDNEYNIAVGSSPGIIIRRDKVGRFIVDVEISNEEALTIQNAITYTGNYISSKDSESQDNNSYSEIDEEISKAITFTKNVVVEYSTNEKKPIVHAVVQMHGILFTQGINEMQTLANLSQSRDILRQTEINTSSMNRLSEYYSKYKHILEFQLKKGILLSNKQSNQISVDKSNSFSNTTPIKSRLKVSRSLSISIQRPINISTTGYNSEFFDMPTIEEDSNDNHSDSIHNDSVDSMISKIRESYRKSLDRFDSRLSNSPRNLSPRNLPETIHENLDDVSDNLLDLLSTKVTNHIDRLFEETCSALSNAAKSPYEKHVDIFMKSSALCRKIGGVIGILCKSGKDRTSMAVSLDITRSLVEDLGVLHAQETCNLLRSYGVRCMNVYANTGQSKYAFNNIQKMSLPLCFRPPYGTNAGNVLS